MGEDSDIRERLARLETEMSGLRSRAEQQDTDNRWIKRGIFVAIFSIALPVILKLLSNGV